MSGISMRSQVRVKGVKTLCLYSLVCLHQHFIEDLATINCFLVNFGIPYIKLQYMPFPLPPTIHALPPPPYNTCPSPSPLQYMPFPLPPTIHALPPPPYNTCPSPSPLQYMPFPLPYNTCPSPSPLQYMPLPLPPTIHVPPP